MAYIQNATNLFLLWLLIFACAGIVGATVYFHSEMDTQDDAVNASSFAKMQVTNVQKTVAQLEQEKTELQQKYTELLERNKSLESQVEFLKAQNYDY